MLPISHLRSSIFTLLVLAAIAPVAFGQEIHPGSMNTQEDIINSLTPNNKPKHGKEKMESVDPKTLPSKTVKDPAFGGSLMDAGLSSANDIKAPKEKPAADAADKKKSSTAVAAESSNQQQQNSKASTANNPAAGDEAKAKSAKPGEKPSATTAAQSDTKPDGNR